MSLPKCRSTVFLSQSKLHLHYNLISARAESGIKTFWTWHISVTFTQSRIIFPRIHYTERKKTKHYTSILDIPCYRHFVLLDAIAICWCSWKTKPKMMRNMNVSYWTMNIRIPNINLIKINGNFVCVKFLNAPIEGLTGTIYGYHYIHRIQEKAVYNITFCKFI